MDITITQTTSSDLEDIIRLFKETIEAVNAKDYSAEQIKVWTNGASKKERWLKKIFEQYFLLAKINTAVAGFASITTEGYLDFMYISKDYQRMGVAQILYAELEKFARLNHLHKIISDVSITAKPFFEKQGFKTVQQQQVNIDGIELTNYKMEKQLQ